MRIATASLAFGSLRPAQLPVSHITTCLCNAYSCERLQVLSRDLAKGICPAERLVCLVIDECHRAVGNSDAVAAVKALAATRGAAARIIGLSATPGSQPEKVQEVINNTRASRICFLSDDDPEVAEYRHDLQTEVLVVEKADDLAECTRLAEQLLHRALIRLNVDGVFNHCNAQTVKAHALLQVRENVKVSEKLGGCVAHQHTAQNALWCLAHCLDACRCDGVQSRRSRVDWPGRAHHTEAALGMWVRHASL